MKATFVIMLLFVLVQAEAQPVLESNQIPAVGSELQYYNLINGPTPQFETGPNQTWDFSDLGLDNVEHVSYYSPSNVPNSEVFPQSNLVLKKYLELSLDTTFTFCNYDQESFYIEGYSGVNQLFPPTVYGQPYRQYVFPLNYLDNYTGATFQNSKSYVGVSGIDSILIKSYSASTYSVDGWGQAILESSNREVLKLSIFESGVDSIFYKMEGESSFEFQATYFNSKNKSEFIAPELGIVVCSVTEGEGDKGQTIYSYSIYKEGILLKNSLADSKSNFTIYPNPSSGIIQLDLGALESANCIARIYDIRGSLINSVMINQEAQVDLSGFSKGMYVLQLTNKEGELLGTKKLVVN